MDRVVHAGSGGGAGATEEGHAAAGSDDSVAAAFTIGCRPAEPTTMLNAT